uniref:SAM domain-containing protein n=1 Tax=Anopheles culicifacies TaxID=139723 RepID=A0A182MKI8_9DIPT
MRKLSLSTGAGMSRQSKSVPQAKKVMPPAVPDMYGKIGLSNGSGGGGGPPTAVIYDTGDGAGRNGGTAVVAGTIILEHHHHHHQPTMETGGPVVSSGGAGGSTTGPGMTAGGTGGGGAGVTAAAPSSLMLRCGPDGIVDYGLDDQGIDLTQSPGRDSPVSLSGSAGSGSRHSTASLDSGRASSYLTGASNSSNRSVSGVGSYGVLSSPRCSVSSCSIGSGSGSGGPAGTGACSHRLSNHSSSGSRTDHDVISEWLMEIHFHEYTYLFLEAGYDLPTIARMTPEDLTAIGIRKPNHRERLKRHIDALKLPDALPGYVPGSIDEWLRLLRLEEYVQPLLAQGYQTVHDVTQLTWEDLEDIGIVKLGHQKKILLAIKRVKDIISGKMMGVGLSTAGLAAYGLAPTIARSPAGGHVRAHYDDMSIGLRSDSSKQQQHLAVAGSYSTFLRQQSAPPPPPPGAGGSTEQAIHFGHVPPHHQMITYPHVHFDGTQAIYRRSSYDDSDITPTNEKSSSALLALSEDHHHHHFVGSQTGQQQPSWMLHTQPQQQFVQQHPQMVQQQQQQYFQGGGTLPRQHQRNNYGVRLALLTGPPTADRTVGGRGGGVRPIAKIVANNLKLPSPALDGGATGGVMDGDGADPASYPVPMPMPPLLGQIENVEMATAALDAMHFSNYTSSPYAVQHHHLHHHTLTLVTKDTGTPGTVANNPSVATVGQQQQQPQQQQQQQQPIYHNHQSMLLQSHSQQQLLHHHASSSSSTQSTPSPPTHGPGGGVIGMGGGQPGPPHHQHPYGAYAGQTLQTTVEVHKVCGQHDNKSNSSLESIDQIPFANENAGTIKQRSSLNRMEHHYQSAVVPPQQHPLLLPTLSSSSSSSSSSLTGSITTTLATGCIQQQLSSPSTVQPVPVAASAGGSSSSNNNPAPTASATVNAVPSATPTPATATAVGQPAPVTGGPKEESSTAAPSSQDIYGTNVLNDIGNMLANLTDELDAMLEEEKCAGISDNE